MLPQPDRPAHSPASDRQPPQMLGWLTSPDPDKRKEAVDELLWDIGCHQGDVYHYTPEIIRGVVPLLARGEAASLMIYPGDSLADEIVLFSHACAQGRAEPEIKQAVNAAVLEGKVLYPYYVTSSNKQAALAAAWLVSFCETMAAA